MKHLHFTQSLEPLQGGGLGRAALDLHLQLLKDGRISHLLTTRSPHFNQTWPATHQCPRGGPAKAYFARELAQHARSLLKETDLVHGHGFYVYPNWAVGGQAISHRKPLVYHPHGMFEPWILQRSRWKKRLVKLLFEGNNMRSCRLWRALTVKEADQIRQQGFAAPIVVAPNGVYLDDFDSPPATKGNDKFPLPERIHDKKRLVFMARLHPKKGLDLLLAAWAKMRDLHSNWELLIAGPDELGYRATVETMIRKLDVISCTTLVGPVTGSAKRQLLHGADVFVLPSYSEGFPVAILEAMACHTPVIGTAACNFTELETEGGGWLCQANPESVHRALSAALTCSDSERKSRGQTARSLVERKYSWPAISATIWQACLAHCT